jgi:hypothetical protein
VPTLFPWHSKHATVMFSCSCCSSFGTKVYFVGNINIRLQHIDMTDVAECKTSCTLPFHSFVLFGLCAVIIHIRCISLGVCLVTWNKYGR